MYYNRLCLTRVTIAPSLLLSKKKSYFELAGTEKVNTEEQPNNETVMIRFRSMSLK